MTKSPKKISKWSIAYGVVIGTLLAIIIALRLVTDHYQ